MQSIREYYNKKSFNYEYGLDNLYFKIYDAITWRYAEPYVPTNPRALVLDAGGGTGRWSVRIAKKGCMVVLIDVSDGMLRQAQAKINEEKLQDQIIARKGNILELDFPSETFDLVFCEHVLFLFPDPSLVIKELARVLKRNSVIIISAQNKYPLALTYLPGEPKEAMELISGGCHYRLDNMRVYTVTPNEFREILETNGLRVERIIGKGITMPLRIPPDTFFKKEYTDKFFDEILRIELTLCEKTDALGLAGHMQAIARKP